MITIIDYGVGNLGSIENMFKRIGVNCTISSDPAVISSASKLLLPGVGAFDHCMISLQNSGLVELLREKVLEQKTPILGICVGFQLMFSESEEGSLPGLGWVQGKVVKFKPSEYHPGLRVPHMGWNVVKCEKQSLLFKKMADEEMRFYFAHSFYAQCENKDAIVCTTEYGETFTVGIEQENIMAVQFHPEKSHKFGMALFKRYAEI